MKNRYIRTLLYIVIFSLSTPHIGQNKQILLGEASLHSERPVDNRYAFIAGIDHYSDKAISNLSSCRLDAVRFSSFLKSSSGWKLPKEHIKLVLDSDKKSFVNSFTELLERIDRPELSTLYFYYSGHGVKGSIVPSNFNALSPETLISYKWIKDEIRKRKINAIIFVLDACYSGSLLDTKDISAYDEAYLEAINDNDIEGNLIVFTATNAYRVTPAGVHESLYTKHLMAALENKNADDNKDGILSAGELFDEIDRKIGNYNAPQFSGNRDFPMAVINSAHESNLLPTMPETRKSEAESLESIITWMRGIDLIRDNPAALKEMIAELQKNKSSEAIARLGFLYREGLGVEKNNNKAISLFISAAADKNAFAEYNLGHFYANGIGFSKNTRKAVRYYEMAAKKGHPFAQYNLGAAYAQRENGICEFDFNKASYWLTQASLNDLTIAFYSLGTLFKHEAETETKPREKATLKKQSFHWYMKAASKDYALAQLELGKHYESEIGQNNLLLARHWYKKACKNEDLQACRKLIDHFEPTDQGAVLTRN